MWHKFLLWGVQRYLRGQVRRRPPRPLAELAPDRVRRVLILNATALGDLMFSTPAFRALKETYPHWQLDLVLKPQFQELAAPNPHISRLWAYPGRRGLLRLLRDLRRQAYDLAIILHGNDPEASLIAWASGAPFLIGSARSPLAFAYSAAVAHPEVYEHAIERRLDYVRRVGADTPQRHLEVLLPQEEIATSRAVLADYFGSCPELLVAFHPTGSGAYKWWPRENYAAVGQYLYNRLNVSFLIISSASEHPVAEALARELPGPALITGGRYSLGRVAGLLSHCRLLVANDSGPLHLALALRVPTIALIGADHPARIGPYQAPWGIALHHRQEVCDREPCLLTRCRDNICLQAITVEEVTNLIRTWWEPQYLAGGSEEQGTPALSPPPECSGPKDTS
jgi:ADP-heptose:LPS heptosyltransferase